MPAMALALKTIPHCKGAVGSSEERLDLNETLPVPQSQKAADSRTPHSLSLLLVCTDSESEPTLESYTSGALSLRWSTPAVCASANVPSSSGGGGFWGFVKFCFWASFFVLLAYFVLGALYNHQQYSARGWDLVPHRDFWRELPSLAGDFGGHVVGNVRSSTGRGGYSSLG